MCRRRKCGGSKRSSLKLKKSLKKRKLNQKVDYNLKGELMILHDCPGRTEQDTFGAGSRDRETNRGMQFNEPEIIQGPWIHQVCWYCVCSLKPGCPPDTRIFVLLCTQAKCYHDWPQYITGICERSLFLRAQLAAADRKSSRQVAHVCAACVWHCMWIKMRGGPGLGLEYSIE